MNYIDLKIRADELREDIESVAGELTGCTGYVCDAVSELADSVTPIYTDDLLEYAAGNPEDMSRAACEFDIRPESYGDWTAYTEAVSATAYYMKACEQINDDLESALEKVAVYELMKRGYSRVPEPVYEKIIEFDASDVDDLDDFREEIITRCLAMNAWR